MKASKRFIKNLDIYGRPLSFNIKGKEDVKSFIGGISSLLYQIVFLVIFLQNFYGFAFNRTPIITVNNLFRSLENFETITNDKFLFSNFFSSHQSTGPKKQNLTTIENGNSIILITHNSTKNSYKAESELVGNLTNCISNPLYKNDKELKIFSEKIQSGENEDFLKCLSFKNDNFTVGGDLISANSKKEISMSFIYNLCDYLNYSKCNITKTSELPLSLQNIFLINFFKNYYINYKNINGYSEFYQLISTPIDFDLDYFFEIKVKKVEISTDNNYIYNIIPNKVNTTYIYSMKYSTMPKKLNTRYELFSLNYVITPDIY